MRLRFWLLGASVLLAVALVLALCQESSDRYYPTHSTIDRSHGVILGCIAYRQHPQSGGKYPATLEELVRPPFNGGPFLPDPEYHCRDGWGKKLHYAVVVNEKGEGEAYAWGERSVNGKTHLCGAKATEDGTVVLFGLPE
jgi:hypothetical protein